MTDTDARRRDLTDRSCSHSGRDKSERIALGLELMSRRKIPGICYTRDEIAAWCGCSTQGVAYDERRILAKMRKHFTREEFEELIK